MNVREPSHLENNLLFENFFRSTFGRDYYKTTNKRQKYFGSIEIALSPTCNLGCKYCYIHRFRDGLYPKEIRERNQILKNLRMLLHWLTDNEYNPNIDLFSGDPLTLELGLEALDIIVDHYRHVPPDLRPEHISIPTNFSFILDDELVMRVETLIKDFQQIGIDMLLSASLDGKYIENDTRPFILIDGIQNSKNYNSRQLSEETALDLFKDKYEAQAARDDAFYEKVFEFASKYRHLCGFHPMIYSTGIERWKDNFLWYQEMFKKYNFKWSSIYLLEVRNQEWNEEQIYHFYEFVKFLIKWQHDVIYRGDTKRFVKALTEGGEVLNITKSPFERTSRGIGCSFQTMLYVRMGDLALMPCHRTSYDHLLYGKFKVSNDKIVGFEAINVESMIQGLTFNNNNLPMCQSCVIKYSCHGGCLGSQLEVTGSMYMPIPTVCELEHAKILGIVDGIKEIGGLNFLLQKFEMNGTPEVSYGLKKLLELKEEGDF